MAANSCQNFHYEDKKERKEEEKSTLMFGFWYDFVIEVLKRNVTMMAQHCNTHPGKRRGLKTDNKEKI